MKWNEKKELKRLKKKHKDIFGVRIPEDGDLREGTPIDEKNFVQKCRESLLTLLSKVSKVDIR